MFFTHIDIDQQILNLRKVAAVFHTYELILIRDGNELLPQKVSLNRKKPTQWQAAQEEYVASLPEESLYISGNEFFDVQSGDYFIFDGRRWEVIEDGILGTRNVVRRVRAEIRPSYFGVRGSGFRGLMGGKSQKCPSAKSRVEHGLLGASNQSYVFFY